MPSMSAVEQEFLVGRWNRDVDVGLSVEVLRDDGAVERRCTRSKAWVAAGPVALVKLEGIAGGFRLSRCWAPLSR